MSEKTHECWKCGKLGATVQLRKKDGQGTIVYIHKQLPFGFGCDVNNDMPVSEK